MGPSWYPMTRCFRLEPGRGPRQARISMPRRLANSGPPTHSSSAWTARTCRLAPSSPHGRSCPLGRPRSGPSRRSFAAPARSHSTSIRKNSSWACRRRSWTGTPSSRVFLADALDNGAGYAVELGKPRVFARILDQARRELTAAWERPRARAHLHGLLPRLPAVLRQQEAARGAGLAARPRHDGPRGRRAPEEERWLARRSLRMRLSRVWEDSLRLRRDRAATGGAEPRQRQGCSPRTSAVAPRLEHLTAWQALALDILENDARYSVRLLLGPL